MESSRGNNGPCQSAVLASSITNPMCTLSCVLPVVIVSLFSAIQSPFHFPKHGRYARAGTAAELFLLQCPWQATDPPFSVAIVCDF